MSPTEYFGLRDLMISPTVPPTIGRPMTAGVAYDFAALMRPRMYGVEREIDDAHGHLALAGLRRRPFRQFKILEASCAMRSGRFGG
jgi:hypothetical protein